MIHICFVSPSSYIYFFEDEEITSGGAEYQMFLLAKELSRVPEFEISFLIEKESPDDNYRFGINFLKSFALKGANGIFKKIVLSQKYFRILKKLKPDIVVTTTANPIAGLTGFYKKRLKFKHIHRTAHLFDVDGTWIKTEGFSGSIYRYGIMNADLILTQTDEHKELLKTVHHITAEVIHNAIEISTYSMKEKKGVLWVGRYEKWKNPEMMFQIARSLSEISFTIICPSAFPNSREYSELKDEANKIRNLTFIESVPFKHIQNYFNSAEIFINTSDKEGFPNTFLQAALAGVPVVSYKVDPDGYLNKHNVGFSCNGNFELLVNRLEYLYHHKDIQQQKGLEHLNYIRNNHDLYHISIKLELLIKKLYHESH
jgi:glycosyltransferase involved in cell wall biosynthesis